MSLLTDFRSRYPIYNDIPDEDLAERLYSRFYSNVPREEFFNKVLPSRPSPEIAEAQRAATAGEEYWTGGRKEAKPLASTMEGMVQEPEISVAEAQRAATAGTEFWARPKAATPMAEYAPVTMPEEQPVEPQVARGRFTIPEPPAPPDTRTILEQVAGQIDPAVTRAFGDTSAAPEQIMPEGLAAYQEEQRRKAQEAVQLRAGVSEVERPERVKKTEILLASILGAAGSSAEWLGRKIDSDSIKSIAETLDRTASALTPEAPTFFDKALMAGGSTLTFVGGGIAASKFAPLFGATVGVARTIGIGTSALLESSAIAQETYEKTMSETGNEDLADTQAIKAAAINLPLSYVTNKLGIFSDKGGRVARTSRALLLEGGQESGQEMLTNILGFKPAGQGVTEAFVLGAVAGGGVKVAVDTLNRFADQASPQERSDIAKQIMADGEEARRRVYAASMSDERIAPLFKEAGITGPNDPKFIELTKVAGELDKNLAQIANDPNVGPELLKSGIVDTGNPAAPEFQGAARTLEQVSQAVQNASTVDAAIAEFNQGVREAGRRAEPVELTEQQLLAQIQGVVTGEPVTAAVTPVTPEAAEVKARIEAPPTGRVEAPRIEVPPTGRVEAAPVAAPEAAPAEVPRIAVPPTGRIETPAAEAVAAPIAVPPAGRVEAAAPVAPVAPRAEAPERVEAAPTFTDLTAPKANKAKGIAKGEVLTFKSEKQAAAYVKSNEVRGFTPRQTEDGWVLSKPVRERTPAQIAAARQRMRVRDDDDLLTALAKMGGLNAANLAADRVDTEDMKSINKGSVLKPFRRTGGMSLDGAAEAMAGMGYDVYDESGRVDATKARELLNEAIMGEKVYSPQGYEILASRNAEEQAQMEAEKEAEAIAITEAMPAMAEDELLAAAAIPREAPIEVPAPTEIPAGAVRLEEPVPGEFVVATPVVQQENLDQAFAKAETQVRQGSTAQYENVEPTYEPTGPSDQSTARVSEPSPEYAVRRRGGLVQLRAGGFYQTLGEQGHLGLVGQRVDSPAKLAELAQIYRNPGYETFRVFFTDQDGRIVEQTGASARLPGQANFIGVTDGTQIFSDWIQSRMEKNNAEGFYILHNHPSGDPTPSQQDADATRAVATNGFLGHIVINGNRYAKIDANGEYELLPLQTFSTQDPVRRQLMQNGVIGTPIAADADVAKIGRLFTTSEDMSVVMAQGNTGVTAIGEIPNQTLLDPQRGPAAIRRFARFNGGAQIFVYTQQANRINPNVVRLYDQGFVTDVVSGNGNSIVAERGFSPNQGTFGGTRTRPIRQLGEERAIQEPSAEALPVLPRARGGEAVGERDAQREEAAREGRAGEAGPEEVAQPLPPYSAQLSRWFSELERQVSQGPESMPAAQWKGWLANRKSIKPDEIFWTGINDFLDLQTGKVSKQQIQDFLKENGVRVGEVELGNRRPLSGVDMERIIELQSERERTSQEDRELADLGARPKFGQYQLPGGENYREVLLTLPGRESSTEFGKFRQRMEAKYGPDYPANMTEEESERMDLLRSAPDTGDRNNYRSTHWNQPNVLAHIRVNDRTDADGKRVLFVEEIQSDWGQEGKKRGFRESQEKELELLIEQRDKIDSEIEAANTPGERIALRDQQSIIQAKINNLGAKEPGVPIAPFVTKTEGWLNLALKKIMIMAAEGGYDRVAFINGEQSADRYDLSKQVSRVYLSNMVFDGDTEQLARATIVVTGRDGIDLITEKQATPARIEEIIGKEAARRLISSPSNTTNTGTPQQVNVLEGDGLKVGGEGMKAFYDQIVPAAVKKLLPKVGGGQMEAVPFPVEKPWAAVKQGETWSIVKDNFVVRSGFESYADALRAGNREFGDRDTGALDKTQPGFDVTPKMREFVGGGMPLFQPLAPYEAGQVPVGRPATPALDDAIRKFQDRNIDIKRIIDSFKEKAGTLLPAFNPYLQEGLSRDRKAAQEKAFEQFELLPMLLEMAKRKVSLAELEEYLHARHAPDYNEEMAKRNPNKEQLDKKMRELNEAINKAPQGSVELQRLQREKEAWSQVKPFSGTEEERNSLSGMSTKEAEAHLNNLPADKKADIEAVAAMVDKMVQKTGDLVINSGADPASIRNPNFRFYVPLKREGFEESGGGYGQGFSVTGKFIRTATGSRRKVVDIISNISEQRIRAINRAENNRVANALLGFVLSAPNPELWTVDKVGKVPRLDRTTGAVVMRPDPEELQADNIIVARVPDGNGGVIERKIVFNPGNETSVRIANAFRRNDTDGISEGLAKVAIITRWFANMSTQYNPIFGGVNFIRDLQSSAVRLTATPLAGKQAELIGTAIKVIPSLYKDLRARRKGERRDSQYAEIFKEFEAEGGRTLLRTNWEGSAEKTKELQKIIQRAGEQSAAGRAVQLPGRVKDIVADWLTDYNDTLESAIRLAAYKMSRDQGISKPEAAMIAKDITVNFSRKGTATDNIGALYAFFNASVQGTANMANTLDVKVNKNGVPVMGRRGQKIVAGGVLLGVIQGLLYGLADYEEGEPPDFVKEKNLVIPFDAVGKIGEAVGITQEERSNKYFSIPIALGYNFFPNIGRIATELALGGFKDPGKKAGEAVKSAFDAFSPIGAAMSWQLIAPTAADPIVALIENKDWTGKPIYRESFDRFASEPGFKLARDNASFAGIYISRALNYMSGGTEYSSGVFPTLLSPTPDQIDYLIGQAFGGIGRELTKIQKTAAAQVTGEELPAYSVPVVSRFFGEVRNQASHSQAFYDNVKLLIKHQQELKGREEAGEDPNEYMARHPEAEISDQARKVMREVQQLRKAKREKIAEGIPKEEVREYDEEITQIMAQFNDEVRLLRSLK